MLAAMASGDVLESDLRVSFVDEQAVDERGVLRDVLSAFWEGAIDRFFEGEGSVVPALTEGATQQTWRAIGRILTAGWRQVGFLPIRVNLTSLAATFLEGDQEVTVSSWVETFGGAEREALLHPRADDPMIMDIITRYGARNVPLEGSLQEQLTRCAYVDMIQRPFFAYDAMGARGTFESLIELEEAYTRLIPNPGVVAEMVRCTPSNHAEQATLDFLIRAIRNMDQATLQLFLRFVSGSSALVVPHININFVPLTGFGRRVVAHTCSVTLDLPIYYSYREFRLELYAVLRGGHWEMDFIWILLTNIFVSQPVGGQTYCFCLISLSPSIQLAHTIFQTFDLILIISFL